MPSELLPSGCGVCSKQKDLLRCSGCRVMPYCGRDHQTADRPSHKSACNAIRKSRVVMEEEELILRNHPGDFMMAADPFTNGVGNFWGIYPTRAYMRARFALVDTISRVDRVEAVETRLDHMMDMLRLCRSDNMGLRDIVPALMLRLHKDQECYDFIKWWALGLKNSRYDWGDPSLPYLDIKGSDVFEGVEYLQGQHHATSHLVPLTLLKIKLLFGLMALEESTLILGGTFPQEILDQIRSSVPQSPAVRANRAIMDGHGDTRPAMIRTLKTQIDTLYKEVYTHNRHFWPALIKLRSPVTEPPEAYSSGSVEESQLLLVQNYEAWAETRGSMKYIEAKIHGDI